MDCKNTKSNNNCSCTYFSCSRHGICCECIEYHKSSNELPGCFFDKKSEKTYNRSVKYFVKVNKCD